MQPSPFEVRALPTDQLSEADVRAEIVDPLLRALGYQAGSLNNIAREGMLRYEFLFLGRKKKSDPPLQGRPDYVMEVPDVGRWVIEAKSGPTELTVEEFEQAQSYALHPNVAASLFVVTNGRQFRCFRAQARSLGDVLFELAYPEIASKWPLIERVLSPAGFRKTFPLPRFDVCSPVASGYGSVVRLASGEAVPLQARASIPMPEPFINALANVTNYMPSGVISRREDGHLEIEIQSRSTNAFTQAVLDRKRLSRLRFEMIGESVSRDPENPTFFSTSFPFDVVAGESLMDIQSYTPVAIPFDLTSTSTITGVAHLTDDALLGVYSLQMSMRLPTHLVGTPAILEVEQVGEFRFDAE